MVTSEAVLLILQAGAMAEGGEVFVLDMGEPIKIVDLAREMIKLSGFKPDEDMPIVFTGIRPGEKLFEEILTSKEGTVATKNDKIFIAKLSGVDEGSLNDGLGKLKNIMYNANGPEIKLVLKELVPSYSGVSNVESGKSIKL